jgi:hypothetical protein
LFIVDDSIQNVDFALQGVAPNTLGDWLTLPIRAVGPRRTFDPHKSIPMYSLTYVNFPAI